ncbi:UNVERIFIED_CONTAM: hypothetical protein K2H54_014006 [Gekko kuhli]
MYDSLAVSPLFPRRSRLCKEQISWSRRKSPPFPHLTGWPECTVTCCNFSGWKLLKEIEVLARYDSQEALTQICKCLVEWYPDREYDLEPSVSSARGCRLHAIQAKQACRDKALRGFLHALGKVLCYVSSLEKKKLLFEDCPSER